MVAMKTIIFFFAVVFTVCAEEDCPDEEKLETSNLRMVSVKRALKCHGYSIHFLGLFEKSKDLKTSSKDHIINFLLTCGI